MREKHYDCYGENNPFYGKHHTENTKRILSEKQKLKPGEHGHNYGLHTNSDERKKQIGIEHSKPVYQFDMELNFISEYPSIRNASETTGITYRVINSAVLNQRKKDKDYIWVYKSEVPDIEEFRKNYKIKKIIVPENHIYQFDCKYNLISEYDNIDDAFKCTNVSKEFIRRSCTGEQKTAGGYIWKYKNDISNLEEYIKTNKNNIDKTTKRSIYHVLNNVIIKEYSSINEAHLDLNIPYNRILKACKNLNNYKDEWFYTDEYNRIFEVIE